MANESEAFLMARKGNYKAAAYLLREEFESLRHAPQKVDLCEWVARCFSQLEDFAQAGAWYTAAGQMILADAASPFVVRALSALGEYEKALDCYQRSQDEDAVSECSTMLHQLRKACAPA